MAQDFIEQFAIKSPVYVDPKRHLYKALGLSASKLKVFSPGSIRAGLRASKKGFRQTKVQGDPWQLGGVLLMKPSGNISYLYKSAFAGDHPNVEDVIEEIKNSALS